MVEVLNLVAKADSPPFQKQVGGLEALGVDTTTLAVPGGQSGSRGLHHYAKFQEQTLVAARDDYDVVHANYGLTAPSALLQPSRPVVLSLWGSDLMRRYGWLCQRCARHCDAVIVMSEEMVAVLDVPCHVIPHGIDLEVFSPRPRQEAQAAVGWDPERRHVLFPYSPERTVKDFPRAQRVVDRVDARYPEPVELNYVTGTEHDEVPTYMNAADALLLTSRREGSPNVVKEALACDVPVVSTDVGDVRDARDDDNVAVTQGGSRALRSIHEQVRRRYATQGIDFGLPVDLLLDLHEALPQGALRPYVCTVDGEFVGGIVTYEHGDTAGRWQGGVRTGTDVDVAVNDTLDWTVMTDAMERGLDAYDLVGADNERINEYKAKFNPDLREFHSLERGSGAVTVAAHAYRRLQNVGRWSR